MTPFDLAAYTAAVLRAHGIPVALWFVEDSPGHFRVVLKFAPA